MVIIHLTLIFLFTFNWIEVFRVLTHSKFIIYMHLISIHKYFHRATGGCEVGCVVDCDDGWLDGCRDGWLDGCLDGYEDGCDVGGGTGIIDNVVDVFNNIPISNFNNIIHTYICFIFIVLIFIYIYRRYTYYY